VRKGSRPKPKVYAGPEAYAIGELIEVKLDHPGGDRIFYPARVIDRSRTHLRVRVIGTGSEISLTRWDVRLFVRRPSPDSMITE
jgi:hypothetical protein